MRGPYVRSAVRAEIGRARRDKRKPDISFLAEETGLPEGVVEHIVWALQKERMYYGTA